MGKKKKIEQLEAELRLVNSRIELYQKSLDFWMKEFRKLDATYRRHTGKFYTGLDPAGDSESETILGDPVEFGDLVVMTIVNRGDK